MENNIIIPSRKFGTVLIFMSRVVLGSNQSLRIGVSFPRSIIINNRELCHFAFMLYYWYCSLKVLGTSVRLRKNIRENINISAQESVCYC
jgi:hypothetical protein